MYRFVESTIRPLLDEVTQLRTAADVVFLDGDHNWYTVLEELRILEDFLRETRRDLVLFTVSGNNGLGIVVDRMSLRNGRFAKLLRKIHDPRARAKPAPRHATGEPT
jgi:hypothetical protein